MDGILDRMGAKKLSDEAIMELLQDEHAEIWRNLHRPPAWVDSLQRATMGGKGWAVVGKRGASSSGNEWAFWKTSRDLDHLAHLEDLSRNPAPDVGGMSNMFAALDQSGGDEGSETESSEEDGSSDGNSVINTPPDDESEDAAAGQNPWDFLLGTHDQDLPWEDDWDEESSGSEVEAKAPLEAKHPPDDPILTIEESLMDPDEFLDFFGLAELPKVPTTDRSRDVLLHASTCRTIWQYSRHERNAVARHIEAHLKEALDEHDVDAFERCTRQHARLREEYDEARGAVSQRHRTTLHR
jgi:hypothetical protein